MSLTLKSKPVSPGKFGGMNSPPTKLLINHGKPNFVINKTPSPNGNLINNKNFNNFTSPTKINNCPNFQIKKNLKKTNSINNSDPKEEEYNEFIQTHKKINEKLIQNENILKEQTNTVCYSMNGNTSPTKLKINDFIKEKQYANFEENRIHKIEDIKKIDEKSTIIISPKPNFANQQSQQQTVTPKLSENFVGTIDGPNYQQRTVVSFSKDLSTEPNNYPDTVKVTTTTTIDEADGNSVKRELIQEFSQLKFEIANNGESIVPVLKKN